MSELIKPIPLYSKDLIEELDKAFPNCCPDKDKDTDRDVWFKAGQRSVVNHLKARLKESEENIFNEGGN